MVRRHMLDGSGEVDFVDFPGLKIIIGKLKVQTIDFVYQLFYLNDFIHVVSALLTRSHAGGNEVKI